MRRQWRRSAMDRRVTNPVNDENPIPTKRIGFIATVCQIVSAVIRLWDDLAS